MIVQHGWPQGYMLQAKIYWHPTVLYCSLCGDIAVWDAQVNLVVSGKANKLLKFLLIISEGSPLQHDMCFSAC